MSEFSQSIVLTDNVDIFKSDDLSYRDAQSNLTFNSPLFEIKLFNLIKLWMRLERVRTDRLMCEFSNLEANKYLPIIKYLFPAIDLDLLRQHFLFACQTYQGDYFNAYNPLKAINQFIYNYQTTKAVGKLPEGSYFGRQWLYSDLEYTVNKELLPNAIELNGSILTLKLDHPIRIAYNSPIQIRDLDSPCPGAATPMGFYIRNIKEILNLELNLKLYIAIYIDQDCIEDAYHKLGVSIPTDDNKESIQQWFDRALTQFYQLIITKGIELVG